MFYHVVLAFAAFTTVISAAAVTSIGSVGAVYFATNEDSGNFLMSADILPSGKLSYAKAISTGGRGGHGNTTTVGQMDGLFSQDSVTVHSSRRLVAVVNAGSDTVSLFSINPLRPSSLTQIGRPMSSGGEFPVSLAFNKLGTQLCVLNSGKANGVQCFLVDALLGLIPQPGSFRSLGIKQTTPPGGPAGSVSDLVFSEDGNKLIVPIKGAAGQLGSFAIFTVSPLGELSKTFSSIPAKGASPFGATLVPGKDTLFTVDSTLAVDLLNTNSNDLAHWNISGGGPCWVAHSPATGSFYLADTGVSKVIEIQLDNSLHPTELNTYPLTSGSLPLELSVASLRTGDFLYSISPGIRAVQVISLQGAGSASYMQSLDLAAVAPNVKTSIFLQGIATFTL